MYLCLNTDVEIPCLVLCTGTDPIVYQPKIPLDQTNPFLTNFKFSIRYIPPLTKYQKYRKIYWGKMYFLRHATSLVCVKN